MTKRALTKAEAISAMESSDRWRVVGENTGPGFVYWNSETGQVLLNPESQAGCELWTHDEARTQASDSPTRG